MMKLMPMKLVIKMTSKNVQRPKNQSVRIDCIMDSLALNDAKKLWDAERAINELTPIKCTLEFEEVPEGVDITEKGND